MADDPQLELFEDPNAHMMDFFWETLSSIMMVPPDVIYHYTSLDAAISIITNQSLWLSNIAFLNDSHEDMQASHILDEISSNPFADFGNDFAEALTDVRTSLDRPTDQKPFVISFCKNDDLLSQWRGYGKLSIGFDRELMYKEFYLIPYNIIYERKQQIELISAIATCLSAQVQKLRDLEDSDDLVRKAFYIARSYCKSLSARLKDAAFSEENEWRLIVDEYEMKRLGQPTVKFRARGSAIIPYIEIRPKSGHLPITNIRLAPNPHPTTKPALEWLLKSAGYNNVEILESAIPYRD